MKRRAQKTPDTVRDLRRVQIVSAAREIVAGEGLEALTIGALEDKLGFSRGVITYHFDSKDEIVGEVFASAVAEIDAATLAELETSGSFEDKVRAVVHANVRGFVDSPEASRILLSFLGRGLGDAKVRAVVAGLYATYRRRCARLIREGTEAGAFIEVDAEVAGSILVGVVIGIAMQVYADPRAIDVDAAIEEAASTFVARLRAKRQAGRPA